jgi:hypothetical protein
MDDKKKKKYTGKRDKTVEKAKSSRKCNHGDHFSILHGERRFESA